MSSKYRILSGIKEVIQENISSYDEAWEILQMTANNSNFTIEEYKLPVTGLGRDPDLH